MSMLDVPTPLAHDTFVVAPPRDDAPYEPDVLTVEERLFSEGYAFNFFQAVWLFERMAIDRRPVGRHGAPSNEALRFRAHQSLSFPPSSIYDIEQPADDGQCPIMTVAFMGLTGPKGVLPRHYTELLMRIERESRRSDKHALRDWFDLFNHRLVSLFYRAWEKYRFFVPYARGEYGRPDPDTFTSAAYSLAGLGLPAMRKRLEVAAVDPRRGRQRAVTLERINDLSLVYYAGLLGQRPRTAANLQVLLADYFHLPVQIEQFQGQWLVLDESNQSQLLGKHTNCQLGVDSVAGERVWDLQSKVRVRIGPLRYEQFLALLPDRDPQASRKAFFLLSHLTRLYLGPELDFDVQLVLESDEVPASQLNSDAVVGTHLGWNAWLGGGEREADADDAVFEGNDVRWLTTASVN